MTIDCQMSWSTRVGMVRPGGLLDVLAVHFIRGSLRVHPLSLAVGTTAVLGLGDLGLVVHEHVIVLVRVHRILRVSLDRLTVAMDYEMRTV